VTPRPLLVGIGGGTGTGKTTLCSAIVQTAMHVSVLDVDAYYLDRGHLSPSERSRLNYDEPAAFDIRLLAEHLRGVARGETISKPIYSFDSHTRVGTERFVPGRLVLVEGIFALWWEEVRELFDLTVFVDAPGDLRLRRRIERDTATRGRTVESVTTQYQETVRPMHERYVEPTRRHAAVIVLNEGAIDAALRPIHEAFRRLGFSPDPQHDTMSIAPP
jgi:uridine kinase